jgi:hypothetical protein
MSVNNAECSLSSYPGNECADRPDGGHRPRGVGRLSVGIVETGQRQDGRPRNILHRVGTAARGHKVHSVHDLRSTVRRGSHQDCTSRYSYCIRDIAVVYCTFRAGGGGSRA